MDNENDEGVPISVSYHRLAGDYDDIRFYFLNQGEKRAIPIHEFTLTSSWQLNISIGDLERQLTQHTLVPIRIIAYGPAKYVVMTFSIVLFSVVFTYCRYDG